MSSEARAATQAVAPRAITPVSWGEGAVRILDQTRLPHQEVVIECRDVEAVADAIRRLAVRGAPALGITAAYGVVLAATRAAERGDEVRAAIRSASAMLVTTRPTAVNIRWALERLESRTPGVAASDLPDALLVEAAAIKREDAEACRAIGDFGAPLVPEGANVLTHCNTGMLCTGGIGTAQGVILVAHEQGKRVHVWVDETRPVLQGARLTAWELQRLGVPMTLVADTAAASLMARGLVDLVIVGADRIAANGDVANKVGTYALAVLAGHHRVPFYVAAPTSTIDQTTGTGSDIPIEERDASEVMRCGGSDVAPAGTPVHNPAFDMTPAGLITAIVTERGVVRPPYGERLRRLLATDG